MYDRTDALTAGEAFVLDVERAAEEVAADRKSAVAAAEDAAAARDADATCLHSAAIHDTANLADPTDVGLLFAPSVDGASHSPREWPDWDDCAASAAVLAEAVRSLAA